METARHDKVQMHGHLDLLGGVSLMDIFILSHLGKHSLLFTMFIIF